MIPSMGGREIGNELRKWASEAGAGTAIVELGVWLGAGTEYLALGVQDSGRKVDIHCYDRFQTTKSEISKAYHSGISLEENQDTLPIVKKHLSKIKANIIYHKGNIGNAKWNKNKRISLYVDDACKREAKFKFAIKTFAQSWIPGKTIIVLMDYYWHLRHLKEKDAQCQPNFMKKNKHCFHHLKDWLDLCCAAFLYTGGKIIL